VFIRAANSGGGMGIGELIFIVLVAFVALGFVLLARKGER
jgi:hypothetical protein